MISIAVCSGKGGAGKTVFASALATMLAELGAKVVLVDADYSVAGLTYLTRESDAVVRNFTFATVVEEGVDSGAFASVPDMATVIVPSESYGN